MAETLGVLVIGLVAGTLGGLLGIGGGIVLIPFLRFGVGMSPAYAAGTCAAAVFCTTVSGSFRHHRLGHVDIRLIFPVIIAGVVATTIFSFAFLWIAQRGRWLDLGTGLVFTMISVRMVIEGLCESRGGRAAPPAGASQMRGLLGYKLAIGTAGGVLPGLLGIGTGGIMVPAFALVLRTPIKIAIGCSLTCFAANALISAAFKYAQGYVDLAIAGPACIGTLAGAYLGATLNRKSPSAGLKVVFGAVFAYVSMKFLLSFFGVGI